MYCREEIPTINVTYILIFFINFNLFQPPPPRSHPPMAEWQFDLQRPRPHEVRRPGIQSRVRRLGNPTKVFNRRSGCDLHEQIPAVECLPQQFGKQADRGVRIRNQRSPHFQKCVPKVGSHSNYLASICNFNSINP